MSEIDKGTESIWSFLLFSGYLKVIKKRRNEGELYCMIIPRDKEKLATIIEFKKVSKKETLEEAADKALKQIEEKRYRVELEDMGIKNIQEIGIAFQGKEVMIRQ